MSKYNTLSDHLSKKLNTEILFEQTENKKTATKENDKASGFFAIIGTIWSKLSGKDNEDPISKALRDAEEKAEASAKEREKKLIQAQEDALVAKIGADFAAQENALELENERQVKAFNLQKKMFDEEKAFWEKNKTAYTAEQMDAIQAQREAAYETCAGMGGSDLKKMNDLAIYLTTKEDGSCRSYEEIQALKDPQNDSEEAKAFRKRMKEYDSYAKKYQKPMISAMGESQFQETLGKYAADGTEATKANAELNSMTEQQAAFNDRASETAKYIAAKTEAENAIKEKDDAETALNKFKTPGDNGYYTVSESDGEATITISDEKLKTHLTDLAGPTADVADEEGNFSFDKYAESLRSQGVPEEVINNIKAKAEEAAGTDKMTADHARSAVANMSAEDLNATKDKMQEDLTAKHAELKGKADAAKSKVDATPMPKLNDVDESGQPKYPNIKGLSEEEVDKYDTSKEPGSTNKAEIDKAVTDAQATVTRIEKDKENRQRRRQEAVRSINASESTTVPENIKDKVSKNTQGVLAGETISADGKRGIEVPDPDDPSKTKFIPKPDPNSSDKDKREYEEHRKAKMVMMKSEDLKPKHVEYETDESGNYKYFTHDGVDENGNPKKKEISEAEAVKIYADNELATLHQTEIIEAKREAATALKSCIKNGTLDVKQFKKLPAATQALAIKMMADPNGLEDILKGTDLAGGKTINELKTAIGDKQEDIVAYMQEQNEDAIILAGVSPDELENVIDPDADTEDDHDTGEEDTENAKNDAGEKLVKGEDGKWYKAKEDGSADTDAGVQQNVSTRKIENPAKKWHKKTYKRGDKTYTTKSYYDKDGNSISAKDYAAKIEAYKKAKQKKQSGGGQNSPEGTTTQQTPVVDLRSRYVPQSELRKMLVDNVSVEHPSTYTKLVNYLLNNIK